MGFLPQDYHLLGLQGLEEVRDNCGGSGEEASVGVTSQRGEKWRKRDAFIEGENNASARVPAEHEGFGLCQAVRQKSESSCHGGQN